ncbi:MAG: GNVR domain-containing protein [Candidatus Sulfotelmatobacter sp.]
MNPVETIAAEAEAPESLTVDTPAPAASSFFVEPAVEPTMDRRRASSADRVQAGEARVLDVLIVVSRRKWLILYTTLATAAGAAIIALLLPNRYTATATILPPQQNQSLAASMIGQMGVLGPMAAMAQKDLGLRSPNDLYVGMLHSRTVEDDLIRRFNLLRVYRERTMSGARRELEDASTLAIGKEGFVTISVEDKDRSRAPQIANAYVEELRHLTQELAVTEAGQRRLFFERQLELAKNNLADAEQALKETELKTGVIQLDSQARAIIDSVVKLRALIAAKEVELRGMRLFSTEQNPDVRQAEEQLSGLRVELARLEKQSASPGDVEVPTGSVPEAGLQYVRRLRDLKYSETIFEMLAKQYEAARLDEARTAAVIQVLDPAVMPDRKSSPQRSLIIVAATLLGFFASALYVLLAETFHRVRSNPEVELRLAMLRRSLFRPHFPPHSQPTP